MDKQFTGMMITLKKRMVCTNQDDTAQSQYLMFGHYDGIDIICTDQWYQLRPKGVADNGGNVDVQDTFGDKYTFKLYFPKTELCEALEEDKFCYEIWRKLGRRKDNEEACHSILQDYPFISIAMINLSQKCVGADGNLLVRMQTAIKEAAQQAKVDLSEIHCAIMPSMGYSDFVLLFLSNNLKHVITVLDCLRKAPVYDQEKQYAMLSNSYAISGFARAGLQKLHSFENLEDVQLSIRVSLRDGVSAAQFKNFFDAELKKILSEGQIKYGERDIDLYQVFGNSDCLILSDMPFDFFVPLFYDKKLLNPRHELFRSYIQHTRSSIRVRIEATEELPQIESDRQRTYEQYQKEFQDLTDALRNFVVAHNRPVRIVNGLQTVMKAYMSLVQFSHCFEIEQVIGTAFEAVTENVEKSLELIEADEKYATWYSEQMMVALRIFREKIEDYLADLRRSDRLFIEGQSLAHPSIGSATKLLFFYNRYINDMAEHLVKMESDAKDRRFTFVVTSGGCDVTTAYDLFSYLDPISELRHSLIIISIPEMSLYDFRGTMFRLLHECFHFCGERRRGDRLDAFLKSLSANTAMVICNGWRGSFEEEVEKIHGSLGKRISPNDMEQIQKETKQIVQKEIDCLRQSLEREFGQRMEKQFDKTKAFLFYGRNMYPEAIERLQRVIWALDQSQEDSSFLRYVYHELLLRQENISERLVSCLNQRSIFFSAANILRETVAQKLEMEQEGKFDLEEETLVREIFRSYTGAISYETHLVNIDKQECVIAENVVYALQDIFKECFADCMAAAVLKLPIEDFLLSFLYETWDYKKAFPDKFRIAIELKVLYGIQGKLGKSTRQSIREKMLYWEKRGFQYQHNDEFYVENVCNWIDKLLGEYTGRKHGEYIGMNYITEYLDKCLNDYRQQDFGDIELISGLSNMGTLAELYLLLERVGGAGRI